MLWLPRFDEKPYSLVDDSPVTVMITAVGPFSKLMHQKQIGDRVWLRGPFGNGFLLGPHQKSIALVGGGYGVAPLFWLARSVAGNVHSVMSIVGAQNEQDILYADLFARLSKEHAGATSPHYQLSVTTENGSAGIKGRVTDVVEPLVAHGQVDGIYACGPHGMLAALETIARRHGIPAQLSWEAYMRCALGICGSCDHKGHVLCMDGPVLAASL